MRRRLFRLAVAGALGRAWAQKSPAWALLALSIAVLRFVDTRAASFGGRARRGST